MSSIYIFSYILLQAKENFKVKEAFEMLVRKVLAKNPTAGSAADLVNASAGGVFGGGKAEKSGDEDDVSSPSSTKKKSGKKSSEKKSPGGASPAAAAEGEKKGKCRIL